MLADRGLSEKVEKADSIIHLHHVWNDSATTHKATICRNRTEWGQEDSYRTQHDQGVRVAAVPL